MNCPIGIKLSVLESQVTRFQCLKLLISMLGDGIPVHSLMGAPQKMTHDAGFRGDRCVAGQ